MTEGKLDPFVFDYSVEPLDGEFVKVKLKYSDKAATQPDVDFEHFTFVMDKPMAVGLMRDILLAADKSSDVPDSGDDESTLH